MDSTFIISAIITIVGISTPILLAGLGELVVEKAGVLNLGVEGMMLVGAIAGFAATVLAPQLCLSPQLCLAPAMAPWFGVLVAALAGAAGALLFGFFVLTLNANQVATGLALTIFGTGLSSLIGLSFVGRIVPQFGSVFPRELATDPIGRVFFSYSPIVYFALIMVVLVAWFLKSTRSGLILRAVGENDLSAHSIGYSVIGVRYAAVAFGGAMAGIGGVYFSLVITPMWAERMTAGRGWIALALVVFASWRAPRLLVGAYFFGVLMWLELNAKAGGLSFIPGAELIPSQFWAAMPYVMTVVVLALISMRDRIGSSAPACLGKPFLPAT